MIVKEYFPAFVDAAPPRRQLIGKKEDALTIPWLKAKGPLRLDGSYVKAGVFVVAVILENEGQEEKRR